MEQQLSFAVELNQPYEKAIEIVTGALKSEGFGVLTSIDVKATLKEKLDVDFKNYIILGACNPPFAYQTLQIEEQIGLMLPCNVVVQDGEDGTSIVSALNPEVAMESVQNSDLEPIAGEVAQKLRNVIDGL